MKLFWTLPLLFLALAGATLGCEHPPLFEPSPYQVAEEGAASESRPCRFDTDCDGYFRCMENECQVPPAITGEVKADTPRIIIRNSSGQVLAQFHLELALNRDEQSRGLMYREEMRDEWGMLFVYPEESHLSFWMKNTLIPLDMIFIDDSGEVVGVVHEAEPLTLAPRSVGRPSRFVLEVNAGLAQSHGIVTGTRIDLQNVDPSLQPGR